MPEEGRCKIDYLRNAKGSKFLPWQYYELFHFVTIPMIGKRPIIPKWNKMTKIVHPTYTGYNTGILTGKVNGLTVIDIDFKDDGVAHWEKISQSHKEIKAPMVMSPSGIHIYFKYVPELRTTNRLKIAGKKIGWDIRNNDTLIVAPPSTSGGAKRYQWVKGRSLNDVKIPKMPKWLLDYIVLAQSTK